MTILAREQSEKLNQCLRELCSAGMPGTQIVDAINGKLGLSWTLQGVFSRVKRLGLEWTATPKAGRPIGGAEYLAEDQRQACYQDPAYEARNGISDRIVCRECFQLLKDGSMEARAGKGGHLWAIHHGMTLKQYRLRNPGAPAFTCKRIAKQEERDVAEVMARQAALYVTPEKLSAARSDHFYDKDLDYIICRVERCGFKSISGLDKHLHNAHGLTTNQYRRERQWPIMTRSELAKKAGRSRNRMAKLKAAAARQVGRPRTRERDRAKYGPRVLELQSQGKSWPVIARIMKAETGVEVTGTRWRLLFRDIRSHAS